MSLFEFTDYKEYVRHWIKNQPKGGRGQFQRFARALNVHPTLVSHIFRAEKNLSLEQAGQLCRYLKLNPMETDYFLLLVQKGKSGSTELSKIFERQIAEMRKKSKKLINRVSRETELTLEEQSTFYSNWYYSGIRLLTSISRYNTVEAIQNYFGLSQELVKETLDFLTHRGLCKISKDRYSLGPGITHLESSSKDISRHHVNWRLKAIESHPRLTEDDLVFSGPLTISRKDSAKVREMIVKVIQELGRIAKDSPAEELRCFNIDWVGIGPSS